MCLAERGRLPAVHVYQPRWAVSGGPSRFFWALMYLSDSVVIVHLSPSDTACTAPCRSVLYIGIFRSAQRSITAGAGKPKGFQALTYCRGVHAELLCNFLY